MKIIMARILGAMIVGLLSTSAVADLNGYPVFDFAEELGNQHEIESYYSNLELVIGRDPNVVPFDRRQITVKDGKSIVSISREHTARNMDPVHFAVALYLNNQGAFRNNDVNRIIAGRKLQMPSVDYINRAREIFEDTLYMDELDELTGLPKFRSPEPRSANRVASVEKQGWQWKKFSERKFTKLAVAVSSDSNVSSVVTEDYEQIGSVSWEETVTTEPLLQVLGSSVGDSSAGASRDEEEHCPFCGLPMSIVRRGRLSPDLRQLALRSSEDNWQIDAPVSGDSANQVTVLGKDEILACSKEVISNRQLEQKKAGFQLLTLSDGSKCIY